jgi:hypothetical protein
VLIAANVLKKDGKAVSSNETMPNGNLNNRYDPANEK